MPRHTVAPLPRAFAGHRDPLARRQAIASDDGLWERLDRLQVLGNDTEGHDGCVNALSWSDDGSALLSGSDDQRLCIWSSSSSSASSSRTSASAYSPFVGRQPQAGPSSPHPMHLAETIATGHRANIFSARFLPHSNTPTVVSCAGDREIRVIEVERLERVDTSLHRPHMSSESDDWRFYGAIERSSKSRTELNGRSGSGVRVLRCHKDRTKRIATENSPFLFLSVSEDGTVRQHDLRRPHRCRSECPEPLFYTPGGLDLYSLSVSTVTPHMFAVAGRHDSAFVCDRRMPSRQVPSWGPAHRTITAGQVSCVRRLGLPEEAWSDSPRRGPRSVFVDDSHITCVKMSPERADEIICAFAKHSTSLFSLYDDPASENMHSSPSGVTTSPSRKQTGVEPEKGRRPPRSRSASAGSESTDRGRDRRVSDHLLGEDQAQRRRREDDSVRTKAAKPGESITLDRVRSARSPRAEDFIVPTHSPLDVNEPPSEPERKYTAEDFLRSPPRAKRRFSGESENPSPRNMARADILDTDIDEDRQPEHDGTASGIFVPLVDAEATSPAAGSGTEHVETAAPDHATESGLDLDVLRGLAEDLEDIIVDAEYESAEGEILGVPDDFDDEDDFEEDDDFEDEEELDSDDLEGMNYLDASDDVDSDDEEGNVSESRAAASPLAFSAVPMIYPRRSFKGARNVETVKDCNFLGSRADKVCSGSDDGNFFVWGKDTGRLEGIWEGDGRVVNQMEQHPSLPIVAVSGIDSTVKIFGPTLGDQLERSFNRTHLRESIIRANTAVPAYPTGGFARASMMQFFAQRGISVAGMEEDEDGEGVQCATQ